MRIRAARRDDIAAIVALLADDELGRRRERDEDPLPECYEHAFAAIDADPRHELVVGDEGGRVVATLHLMFLPSLSHQGGERAQIEAVRTASSHRGRGLGRELMRWAIERARDRGCRMVQLTTDKTRADARRFYECLGFRATHEGMKLPLAEPP